MTRTVTYEIHTMRSGSWYIDSVQKDRDHALLEARNLLNNPRQIAVKVIEEKYDDETDKTISTTIFNEKRGAAKSRPKYKPEERPEPLPRRVVERPKKKDDTDFVSYLIKMVLIVGGICLSLIGLGMIYMHYVGG